MARIPRLPSSEKCFAEAVQLLVALDILDGYSLNDPFSTLSFRLRSVVMLSYAMYGPASMCRIANLLIAIDPICGDMAWLEQVIAEKPLLEWLSIVSDNDRRDA